MFAFTFIPRKMTVHGAQVQVSEEVNTTILKLHKNDDHESLRMIALYFRKQDEQEAIDTIECESDFRKDVYGDKGLAFGIAQFHEKTFIAFKKRMGEDNLNYKSAEDQLKVMGWAFSHGLKNHWSCWKRMYGV